MKEDIVISDMFIELELDKLKEEFIWAKDELTIAKFVSLVKKDKIKIKKLLETIPMELIIEYTQKRFNSRIYSKRKEDLIKKFLRFNLTSNHIIELIKIYQAVEERPPAALTFYHVKRPQKITNNQLLNNFLDIPNSKQLESWKHLGKRYGIQFYVKSVDIRILDDMVLDFISGEKKKFYSIYNPSMDWIAISSSKVMELYEVSRFLKKHLKINLSPFNFGNRRTSLPDDLKPDFWLQFFKYLNRTDDFSDPRINFTFLTDPTDRSIKKYSISSYRDIPPTNLKFLDSINEEIENGLWIEGIKGTLIYKDNYKLHIYIRDYKQRTTFSLMKRPKNFTLEQEIWILATLFDLFSEYISPYVEKIPYQPRLTDY